MKKLLALILSGIMLFALSGCGGTKDLQQEAAAPAETEAVAPEAEPQSTAGASLVVYFSATGTTEKLAETIADMVGADLYEIVPEEPYTDEDLDYNDDNSRANKEMNDEAARPAIASETIENIDDYDTIFIGYPIWWGTMPRIINTFVEIYDLSGKTIMPFCTSGGSGIATSETDLRNACGNADVRVGLRGPAQNAQIEGWLESNNISY